MKSLTCAGAALTAAALFAAPAFAQSRDQIRIVGSSTVFPYTQAVAEQFAGMTGLQRAGGRIDRHRRRHAGLLRRRRPGLPRHHRRLAGDEGVRVRAVPGERRRPASPRCCSATTASRSPIRSTAPDLDLTKAQLFQALASEVEVDGADRAPTPTRSGARSTPRCPTRRSRSSARRRPRAPATPSSSWSCTPGCEAFAGHRRARGRREGRGLRAHAPGRAVHRGRRERQPHRAAPGGRPERPRHLRLLVPLREQRQAEGRRRRRRRPRRRHHRLGRATPSRGRSSSTSRTPTAA